jgi:hypothetical protein
MPKVHMHGVRSDADRKELVQRFESTPRASTDNEMGELSRHRTQRRCDGFDPFNGHETGHEGG